MVLHECILRVSWTCSANKEFCSAGMRLRPPIGLGEQLLGKVEPRWQPALKLETNVAPSFREPEGPAQINEPIGHHVANNLFHDADNEESGT